jgi:2'-5' RNA ligase
VRVFVALELPQSVAAELVGWARHTVAAREGVRRLPAESLHATVAFLGECSQGEVDAVARCVEAVAQPCGALTVGVPLWLPPRNPRTLAVELHEDEERRLTAMHDALAVALTSAIAFEPERRRFRPHVTVARLRAGAARHLRRELEPTPQLSFVPAALTLYRSELLREGARYVPVVRANLY